MKEAKREREAVVEIERLGGRVIWSWHDPRDPNSKPPGPAWLKALLGENLFTSVAAVEATRGFGNEGLEYVGQLRSLYRLNLSRSRITDDGLKYIEGLRGLQELLLEETQITDAGLEHVTSLKGLSWLYLGGTKVTDAGLKHRGNGVGPTLDIRQ